MITRMQKAIAVVSAIVVSGFGFVGTTVSAPLPPGLSNFESTIFDETFNGGVFHEAGSSFSEAGAPPADPPEIFFNADGVRLQNIAGQGGVYNAAVSLLPSHNEYVVQLQFKVNDGLVSANAMLLRPFSAGYATEVDLLLKAVQTGDNTSPWDIQITSASGTTLAGLSLPRNDERTITVHDKGNGFLDLYEAGTLIGTYADRSPGTVLGVFQVGHVSDDVGFESGWFDNVQVFIPEPSIATLLSLSGLACLIRRRNPVTEARARNRSR